MSRTPRLIDTDEFVLISELLDGEEESTDLAISRARLAESPNPDHIDQLQARYDLICRAKKSIMAVNRIASTIDAARAEGYRQGVEDGESRRLLRIAHGEIQQACVKYISLKFYTVKDFVRRRRIESMKMHMRAAIELRNRAFRGARGVKRAEIRQRLERMDKSNG